MMKLRAKLSDKPWGQTSIACLPAGADKDRRIGEIAFEHPEGTPMPVLIKYLYTTERLSIQVHPDNLQARSFGHQCGKDEMWIVLEAEPGATIGLGLKRTCTPEEVRTAIDDGSIVDLVDWRPVQPGDVIYNRAGTIHAAGAGLVLLEVQQSIDLTYRLYDYGRPRELHLEKGLAVSRFEPHFDERDCRLRPGECRILADGPHFGAAWCSGQLPPRLPTGVREWQLVVVSGTVSAGGAVLGAGEAAVLSTLAGVEFGKDAVAVVAWPTQEALAKAA
jgi:mannose-6-phosphate isomerase